MKSFLCGAALAASLQLTRGQITVAVVDPTAEIELCATPGSPGVIPRSTLEMECGSLENPCPVIIREAEETVVECGATFQIQGLESGAGIVTQTVIHGYVIGRDTSLVGGTNHFAVTYPVLKALCPLPCDHGENSFTCVAKPDDCTVGGNILQMPHVDQYGVIASFLSNVNPLMLRGAASTPSWDPSPFVGPVAGGADYMPPHVVAPMVIFENETVGCGDTATPYTEVDAHLADSCGGESQPPCPLGGRVGDFGQCYESVGNNNCLDVEFWMEGLADTTGTYCGSAGTPADCPRIGSFHKRFRLTENTTDETPPAPSFMDVPIGAWRDMCPFECATATAGGDTSSFVCASEAAHCVQDIEDTPVTPPNPTEWEVYTIPGSATAKIHYISHNPVACDSAPSSSTSTTTTPNQTTTEAASGASRTVVGGLTTFAIACGVLYL